MITSKTSGDTPIEMMATPVLASSHVPDRAAQEVDEGRLRGLVDAHGDFIWRSLRRLGLAPDAAEDAAQRVFLVASERLAEIRPGAEQAFLFQAAVYIAARTRRSFGRRREELGEDIAVHLADPSPGADELLDRARARVLLAEALDGMDLEVRAVFILFELEGKSTAEIAQILAVPAGTVASRLRRAREGFEAFIKRVQARRPTRNTP